MKNYKNFFNNYIVNLIDDNGYFKFSQNLKSNNFSLCFGIHSLFLVKDMQIIDHYKELWINELLINLKNTNLDCSKKPHLQLLNLTISSLIILGSPKHKLIHDICLKVISKDPDKYFNSIGVKEGRPGSGNLAMFLAIFYIYLRDYYNYNFSEDLNLRLNYHKKHENNFGLWSISKKENYFKYSFFQNGYHQYEIYNYLNKSSLNKNNLVENLIKLADDRGQFAPYPGGGGCYDYDAVYLLTMLSDSNSKKIHNVLKKTYNSILNDQNLDGGFGESNFIRPLNVKNFLIMFKHINFFKKEGLSERLLRFIAHLRPKHNLIKTHWSDKRREWNESNIFNSWFRMMTLARIEIFLDKKNYNNWNFLNFPGIGFHEK